MPETNSTTNSSTVESGGGSYISQLKDIMDQGNAEGLAVAKLGLEQQRKANLIKGYQMWTGVLRSGASALNQIQ